MANSINFSTNITSRGDQLTLTGGSNVTSTTTSSNVIGATTPITSSAWTQLSLGSLEDVCVIYVLNDATVYSGSVVLVATGSSGQNIISKVGPGQSAIIPWSGSLSGLYAKSVSTIDTVAIVQHIVSQS